MIALNMDEGLALQILKRIIQKPGLSHKVLEKFRNVTEIGDSDYAEFVVKGLEMVIDLYLQVIRIAQEAVGGSA